MDNSKEIIDNEVIQNLNKEVTNFESQSYPNLVTRIKALVIDSLILLFIFSALSILINSLGDIPNFVKGFLLIFMIYLYDPIFTSFYGSTIGHRLMNLTVRKSINHDAKISIFAALLRLIFKLILGWISFLTVTSHKQKRAIHDLISGSIVIYRNK